VPGTCTGPAADGQPCDTSADLGCMPPARCVGAATEAGVAGVCQMPTATGC